jgi:DNA-binding NtrC family response regulator
MAPQISVHHSERPAAPQRCYAKVLVVDDDAEFRALARHMLDTAGFEAAEASTVSECMAHLRSHTTDVVILDLVLPDQDGIEALSKIKTLFPEIRVVTVSGAVSSELYLSVSSYLGADASLDKSRIASLCALLNVVLDR